MAAFRETYLRSYWDYVNITAATIQGTNGVGIANVGVVNPQNYMIRILRASAFSNSSGTPTFEIFRDNNPKSWQANNWAADRTRRVHFASSGKNDPGDFNQPPLIDEGEIPLLLWTGGTNGDICQASLLIAVFQKDPILTLRDHRGLKHQEELETMESAMFPPIPDAEGFTGSLGTPAGLRVSNLWPWSSEDPENNANNPAVNNIEDAPGIGNYVGGDAQGPQHPRSPFRGRVLPDHSVDEKGGLE